MRKSTNATTCLQKAMNAYGIPTEIDGIVGSQMVINLNSIENPDDFIEFIKPYLKDCLPKEKGKKYPGWYHRIDRY